MALKLTSLLYTVLICASVLSGPYAIYLAARMRLWRAIGAILAGLSLGLAGLFASLKASDMYFEALREHNPHALNDMVGFGQVVLGFLGLLYFLAIFVLAVLVFSIRWIKSRQKSAE
ncbi:hypothetical protein [Sphingobium sp. Sx8-8]|uniref:hypothetical protein n=1 Tax=Sphingobium sp. Sx8-8 TaxID=2933617 RepID=UPI001F565231|nr:hypothetical protein [Sphingobium sp. Sx8-8]